MQVRNINSTENYDEYDHQTIEKYIITKIIIITELKL